MYKDLGVLTLDWGILDASHCTRQLFHVRFWKQDALGYS